MEAGFNLNRVYGFAIGKPLITDRTKEIYGVGVYMRYQIVTDS